MGLLPPFPGRLMTVRDDNNFCRCFPENSGHFCFLPLEYDIHQSLWRSREPVCRRPDFGVKRSRGKRTGRAVSEAGQGAWGKGEWVAVGGPLIGIVSSALSHPYLSVQLRGFLTDLNLLSLINASQGHRLHRCTNADGTRNIS